MRIFTTLIFLILGILTINAQTTISYNLNNTNIHISPTPTGGGFSPQSNYTIITKPLVAEPYAINPQAGVNAATIYVPAGNVNNVFFGGDLPSIGTGTSWSAVPIFTTQTFSQADFPIYLECNFYSRSSSPLYNEGYLFIVPSNYQYFASPTTYTPQQTTQREGVLFGGHPNNLRIIDHKSTTQASVFTNYPHSFTTYGNWYKQTILLDYVNGDLIVRSATINNNNVMTNVNLGAYTWLNSIRLGIAADDMAEGFEIISDYSDMVADFEISDTTICAGECVDLTDLSMTSFCTNCNTFQWSIPDAVTTTSTLQNPNNICFQNSGTFPITLIVSNSVESDTITKMITALPSPNIDLGNDTILCNNQTVTLDATIPNAVSYLWSNNSINPTLTVNSIGTYSVEVFDGNCSGSDTIIVDVPPISTVNLGNDTAICEGRLILLDVSHPNAESYLWHNGSTKTFFSVENEGQIYVTLENHCEVVSDTINIIVSLLAPLVPNLGNDQVLCPGQTVVLDATTENALNYVWQDSTEGVMYFVTEPGVYEVTVSNACLSRTEDIEFTADACCNLFVPDAFTPNEDGNNDIFHAYTNCEVSDFSMIIFDRWGGKLFETTDINQGWNGMKNGQILNNGVYVYMISFNDGFAVRKKEGSLTLIR